MREYELYLVLDADAEEDTVSALVEKMTQVITAGNGESGEVIKVDARGKRRLAYPIGKKPEGQDIILNFHAPPQALSEMERILKLDEQVLRYLIVRTDED
jgi:small subunit ribosomal protein S6